MGKGEKGSGVCSPGREAIRSSVSACTYEFSWGRVFPHVAPIEAWLLASLRPRETRAEVDLSSKTVTDF